jgi:hypothetical protein
MAAHPLRRLRLNQPAIRETVRGVVDAGTPGFVIALEAGITHFSKFSELVNADEVPASSINITRLERIAERIGFPKSRLFLDADR